MARISTISDKEMADLQRRAEKAAPPMFSREAVRRRVMYGKQQAKASQN